MSQEYFPLEPLSVIEYVKQLDAVQSIFSADEDLTAEEIGDGNLNLVFKIRAKADPKRTVVVKQSLPYMRLVGDEWPLPIERARIEAQALEIEARLCPEHTPHVYHFDPVMYAIVMQNLDNHIIMRKGLSAGVQYPHFADHIGKFLAKTLGYTSDLVLDYRTKKEQVGRFINPELCKITEDLVFTEPYRPTERNAFHLAIEPEVLAMQANAAVHIEVAKMKEKFMTQAQALVHGDLHTGSIMINHNETVVIDPEFAFYGPMGFDIGAVIGNLLLSYASHETRTKDPIQQADFRRYLTESIIRLWKVFEQEFQAIWDHVDAINMPKGYQADYMLRLLQDAAGMGGCKMLRRVVGLAGVSDLRGIEDDTDRATAESLALNIGQTLLLKHSQINTIEALVELAVGCRPTYG